MTASAHYSRPIDNGNNWSTSLIWGRNHDTFTRQNVNSYLLETVYPVSRRNLLTGRAELVDKDELFADDPDLESRPVGARATSSLSLPPINRIGELPG